jgi:hypothetical protein
MSLLNFHRHEKPTSDSATTEVAPARPSSMGRADLLAGDVYPVDCLPVASLAT